MTSYRTIHKLIIAILFAGTVLFLGATPAHGQDAECVGEITGTTATTNGHCVLVAYRYADGAPGPDQLATSLPQTLVDLDDSGEVLEVTAPDCYWQIDLVDAGATIANPLTSTDYYTSNGWLVDSSHGGGVACAPPVTTTTTTSTTVPETTTTTPEIVVTTTAPVITTVATTAPPTTSLARTGSGFKHSNLVLAAVLLIGYGIAATWRARTW